MRPVHQSAFLQDLSCRWCHRRLSSFNNHLASMVSQGIGFGITNVVHAVTGNANITRNIIQVLRVVELGTCRTDNVSTQQGTTFALDVIDRGQFAFRDTIRFIDVSTGVRHGNGNGAIVQQFLSHGSCPCTSANDHDSFSLQGITFVFQHAIGKVDDSVARCLVHIQVFHEISSGLDTLVLSIDKANFLLSTPNTGKWDVLVRPNVLGQFGRVGLAETLQFCFRLIQRIEIRSSHRCTQIKPCDSVGKDVVKGHGMNDAVIHMRPQM
mmetsp:Transcript_21915/g.40889  ORF Transcript_21915/g.40889 Transcript_21915/m.40889 type:complete len:267 (+) Transcript_21915:381-1181(+)